MRISLFSYIKNAIIKILCFYKNNRRFFISELKKVCDDKVFTNTQSKCIFLFVLHFINIYAFIAYINKNRIISFNLYC